MERFGIEELQNQMQSLRSMMVTARGHSFLDLFDELLQQHEFGLALHAVCDYILQPDSPRVSEQTIDQIYRLHAAMKINDECVEQLKKHKLE